KGDNAPMAVIELVREPVAKKATVKEAESATKRAAKDRKKSAEAEAALAAEAEQAPPPVVDETTTEETTPDETAADDTTTDAEATDDAASAIDLPAGAVAPLEDGSAPEGYSVKGNADSGKYHVEGSRWYDQTVAEFWFADAAAAEAAGFTPAGGAAKGDDDA
ncbi:MAG: 50S ribosomal protein L17, partial [Phycicoccus sp.]